MFSIDGMLVVNQKPNSNNNNNNNKKNTSKTQIASKVHHLHKSILSDPNIDFLMLLLIS